MTAAGLLVCVGIVGMRACLGSQVVVVGLDLECRMIGNLTLSWVRWLSS